MIFLIPRTFALASNVLSFLCVLLAVMLAFGAKSVSAQTTIYSEDFQSYSENYGFRNGGNSGGYDGTETNWTIAGNTSTLTGNNDYFMSNSIMVLKSLEDVTWTESLFGRPRKSTFRVIPP